MLANNRQINWLPEHIRDGRFGNFLESNVDWALSRERYWGTPLPIWVCEATGYMEAVGSYEELRQKPGAAGFEVWEKAKAANPSLADHLRIHKPYIDAVTYDSPKAPGKRMRRVPDVIDCWFDSGAMPFAQWGYPHKEGSQEQFRGQFPADFISEAIDQTRGWFYSQLAISTLLFGQATALRNALPASQTGAEPQAEEPREYPYPHPFRNCIVLGLMLGEDGQKMSKSKRNYREPREIFDRYGADALRWYFFSNQPPWTSIRYSEQAIKETMPEFLLRLWNVYSFFVIYANIDGFDPAAEITRRCRPTDAGRLGHRPQLPPAAGAERIGPLDPQRAEPHGGRGCRTNGPVRQLQRLRAVDRVRRRLEQLVRPPQPRPLLEQRAQRRQERRLLDALRMSFDHRQADRSHGALPGRGALAEPGRGRLPWCRRPACLVRQSQLAPVESVHLCDYPTGDAALIDEALSAQMGLVREIVSLGLSARMGAKLKVRQPLAGVEVILADRTHLAWLEEHAELICGELNVKKVDFADRADHYINYTVLPDLKRLGPRLGKRLPAVKKLLAEADGGALLAELKSQGKVTFQLPDGPVVLDADDIQVRLQAKEGWAAAQGKACVVVLSTELNEDLLREGTAREVARTVNDRRKEMNCQFTDRVEIAIVTDSAELRAAIEQFRDYIMTETLAVSIGFEPLAGVEPVEVEIGDYRTKLYIRVVPTQEEV